VKLSISINSFSFIPIFAYLPIKLSVPSYYMVQSRLVINFRSHLVNFFTTSMNVLWIRNCSRYCEPVKSHALGGLTGSQQTMLLMQPQVAGRCHNDIILEVRLYQSMHISLKEQSCLISSLSDLIWNNRTLSVYEEWSPQQGQHDDYLNE